MANNNERPWPSVYLSHLANKLHLTQSLIISEEWNADKRRKMFRAVCTLNVNGRLVVGKFLNTFITRECYSNNLKTINLTLKLIYASGRATHRIRKLARERAAFDCVLTFDPKRRTAISPIVQVEGILRKLSCCFLVIYVCY